jgi:hypothetical protein
VLLHTQLLQVAVTLLGAMLACPVAVLLHGACRTSSSSNGCVYSRPLSTSNDMC